MSNIKQARERRGITQMRLAIELGIAQETISGYEIDRIKPSADVLCKIADFLNVSTDYLLGRITEDKNYIDESNITEKEKQLLFTYRLLDDKKQNDLLWYADALKQR